MTPMPRVAEAASRLKLSSLDVSFLGRPANLGLLYYRGRLDPARIYQTILATCTHLPSFSSRIVHAPSGEYFLRFQEGDFGFSVEESSRAFAPELLERRNLWSDTLAPYFDTEDTALDRPLFGCRVTLLRESTVLGFSISHSIADGETLKYATYLFSALYGNHPVFPASNQRSFPFQRAGDRPRMPEDYAGWDHRRHELRKGGEMRRCVCNDIVVRGATVDEVLSAATGPTKLTRSDVVAALLVKELYPRIVPGSEVVRLRIPVDLRRATRKLEPTYIGNGYWDAWLHLPIERFHALDVAGVAAEIHAAIRRLRTALDRDGFVRLDVDGVDYEAFAGLDPPLSTA